MRHDLLTYYERELLFLRQTASGFAEDYPKIARRLSLEADRCEDPHVERLIEGFAYLAARIHLKIDDEFPEITDSLLQVLYPHYLAPVPSMGIVQFVVDPRQGKLSGPYNIGSGTSLYSKSSTDAVCRFRTAYPVTLWPIRVASAKIEISGSPNSPAALVLRLEATGDSPLSELGLSSLRFFLSGPAQLTQALYESIFGRCQRIDLHFGTSHSDPIVLPSESVGEVGFGRGEGCLPYSDRSFLGYRLLQEYFALPEKFLFFDLLLGDVLRQAGTQTEVEIVFRFSQIPPHSQQTEADNFRLGCTPIVNLFEQTAEPIRLDHAHTEYRVIPDIRRQGIMEVHSIDSVASISPQTGSQMEFQPFYSFRHSLARESQAFWHAMRRPSLASNDAGTEVFLTLVDLNFRPTLPPTDVVTVRTTCTNRDLPGVLLFGHSAGDFQLEGAAPIESIVCLINPTKSIRPPLRGGARWRLISHLTLNYLSLLHSAADNRPEALQEILRLYDPGNSPVILQQITGITSIASRQVMRRIRGKQGSGFARGIEVTLGFDENNFVGSGVFLFASVLEKFLGLYVSINSFSELVATSKQRGVLKRWHPRSGYQTLL
ncbi:MAG: type VI secretion system baseplate subunit TssF [Acidobacteria bacterium]|nr:MAG: type VI secretion system baseplate subunit TssF [Acidobacteriota bacterium]